MLKMLKIHIVKVTAENKQTIDTAKFNIFLGVFIYSINNGWKDIKTDLITNKLWHSNFIKNAMSRDEFLEIKSIQIFQISLTVASQPYIWATCDFKNYDRRAHSYLKDFLPASEHWASWVAGGLRGRMGKMGTVS